MAIAAGINVGRHPAGVMSPAQSGAFGSGAVLSECRPQAANAKNTATAAKCTAAAKGLRIHP
jgi:hypothetical protein